MHKENITWLNNIRITRALAHSVKKNYKEINEQRNAEMTATLFKEEAAARKIMARSRDPIVREPVRRYPFTMLANVYPTPSTSNWRYGDKRDDERNESVSWLDDIPSDKKYY